MTDKVRPWGSIQWLLPKVSEKKWHVITSSSFEERCTSLVEYLLLNNYEIPSSSILKITNPPSAYWEKAEPIVAENMKALCGLLANSKIDIIETDLLGAASVAFSKKTMELIKSDSVILDISTLPKRFFLFIFKQLLQNNKVKNLVVTYAHANSYPEEQLCEDAQRAVPLQGYICTGPTSETQRLIVDVGYVPLSVESTLEEAKNNRLDFIFPFPPASPAYRRNWKLLSMLMPDELPRNTQIHRIHGLDAFEVFERLFAIGKISQLKLLPLGPKPHALGMAMAYIRLEEKAELIYSQPLAYRENYSEGAATDANGNLIITAYCLKKSGKQLF